MRPDIHPEYRQVLFHDLTANTYFLVGSTLKTDRTKQWEDGNTYPYVTLDVSSASHPSIPASRSRSARKVRLPVSASALVSSSTKEKTSHESALLSEISQVAPPGLPDCPPPRQAVRDLQE